MQHSLILALDLGGTFVFAISGGVTAVRRRLDLFGVLVLAFSAGAVGGIARDILIGAVPPAAFASWHYITMSALAGVTTFFGFKWIERWNHPVRWLDSVGLAFFAVAGTEKAMEYGIDPMISPFLGMLTGIGGGMLRDVLANRIPSVLRSDLYALAALIGSIVVAVGHILGWPPPVVAITGALVCFSLRVAALRYGWHLPRFR